MEKVCFRFTEFQNRAQKNVNGYIIHNATDDRVKREMCRLCHTRMAYVLADALYPDNAEYDLRISEDKGVGIIIVGEDIEYCIRCNEITISEDLQFITYRGYGINYFENVVYITQNNRIVTSKNFGVVIDTEYDLYKFDEVYEYIDKLELEKGKIKHG